MLSLTLDENVTSEARTAMMEAHEAEYEAERATIRASNQIEYAEDLEYEASCAAGLLIDAANPAASPSRANSGNLFCYSAERIPIG